MLTKHFFLFFFLPRTFHLNDLTFFWEADNATYVLPSNGSAGIALTSRMTYNKQPYQKQRGSCLAATREKKHFVFAIGVTLLSDGSWKMFPSRVIALGHLFVQGTKESRQTSFACLKKKKYLHKFAMQLSVLTPLVCLRMKCARCP